MRVQWASLCSDGRLGHLLIHMQLESRAPGYWLVHKVVPPIGLQIHLAPWVLSLFNIERIITNIDSLLISVFMSKNKSQNVLTKLSKLLHRTWRKQIFHKVWWLKQTPMCIFFLAKLAGACGQSAWTLKGICYDIPIFLMHLL